MPTWLYFLLPLVATIVLAKTARTDYRIAKVLGDVEAVKTIPILAVLAWTGLVMSCVLRAAYDPSAPSWAQEWGQKLLANLFAAVAIGSAGAMALRSWRLRTAYSQHKTPSKGHPIC